MTPEAIIKKLLAQRERWVDLVAGKRVRVRRPAEMEVHRLLDVDADGKVVGLKVGLDAARQYVVDWEGVVEADLVPSGASDAVPFSPELWAVVAEDRRDWVSLVSEAIVEMLVAHEKERADALGN